MRYRSESRVYRAIAASLRRTYPRLGSHLAAAAAREIERRHALTDYHGRVFVRTDDARVLEIPNE